MFEFNKQNTKKILLIITYTILLCFALINYKFVLNVVGYVLNLLKPFLFGFCIAFILNIPLSKIENIISKIGNNPKQKKKKVLKNTEKLNKKIRAFSIVFSLIIFIGIICLTLFLVIPEFVNTISILKENIPEAFNQVKEWSLSVMDSNPALIEKINEVKPDWDKVDTNITEFIKNAATGLIGFSIEFVVGVFSGIVNFFIGIVFAVYMLSQKEKLLSQLKRVCKAYFSESKCEKMFKIGSITNDTFKRFFGGQFIEAILLGVMCFVGMSLFKMPYALTISVLIGVTALIPVFGAFFGTGIGAILILALNPTKAFWFVIYILVIQQIDGNLIYPKVVGNSVGLPAIWVMLAVLVGGNSLGIVGMLVGVPIASVMYKLIKERVSKFEKI